MRESERLLVKAEGVKAEGVKDCVDWIKKKIKETNKEIKDRQSMWCDEESVHIRLKEQVALKVSLEKYMKKLKHEACEAKQREEDDYDC